MEKILRNIKKLIPRKVFSVLAPFYHYQLALLGALIYHFPSKNIKVVLVTGTKGKSSTTEFINAMLEAAGKKTALLGTIRFKIGEKTEDPLTMYLSDIFTIPVNLAGLPAISLPCAFDGKGLPIGLQIIGKPLDEALILRAASLFEGEMKLKKLPDQFA